MIPKKDGFILSTGKEFNAYNNVIGLGPTDNSDEIHIHDGYDGTVYIDDGYSDADLTNSELVEIAHYMIEQWGRVLTMLLTRKKE